MVDAAKGYFDTFEDVTILFAIVYGISYGVCFAVNDFSMVWGQNVSAMQHYFPTMGGLIPFVTWDTMTVGGYFRGMAGAAFLNCLVCAVFALPFALFCKNVYAAFCGAAGFVFLHLTAIIALSDYSVDWALLFAPPLGQAFTVDHWFTDGGNTAVPPPR
ncbi:MAG: hypothetical protein LBS85_00300 [Clostridiales Family XIII bacterium]|jgi:hypothetical protein|nr:hypothetical protein [Clostridiales Family XIII bacterium]